MNESIYILANKSILLTQLGRWVNFYSVILIKGEEMLIGSSLEQLDDDIKDQVQIVDDVYLQQFGGDWYKFEEGQLLSI